jgi:glucose-6-phosphate dehydrogenase assembly protein OpcA
MPPDSSRPVDDVWSAQDTTPDAIEAALRRLLRERHGTHQELAEARVLNLIVVVDRAWKGEIANRLERVGRYHASRTILCAIEEGRETLDAVAVMRYDPSPGGCLSVMHERVEIDIGPAHVSRLDTIVDPVKMADLTTLLWAPHGHHEAIAALAGMCDVILLDSDEDLDPGSGLSQAAELLRSAYVVDLAWLRTTPWRERLAASFDLPDRRTALGRVRELAIRHRPSSQASAMLLTGWLASRLHWQVGEFYSANGAGRRGSALLDRGRWEVKIALEPHDQEAPGLAGVTVGWGKDSSLSLDRAVGGLLARERGGGDAREWRVLGASRGEAGILGEGVRQALLRDPTYGPALSAAREMAG